MAREHRGPEKVLARGRFCAGDSEVFEAKRSDGAEVGIPRPRRLDGRDRCMGLSDGAAANRRALVHTQTWSIVRGPFGRIEQVTLDAVASERAVAARGDGRKLIRAGTRAGGVGEMLSSSNTPR